MLLVSRRKDLWLGRRKVHPIRFYGIFWKRRRKSWNDF
jgi:hypothetical protein